MHRLGSVFASGLVVLTGCASAERQEPGRDPRPEPRQEPETAVVTTRSAVRITTGAAALSGFEPAREPMLEGGECSRGAFPGSAGESLTAHFPSLRETDTSIAIVVDSTGKLLRYAETRGLPTSAAMRQQPRTLIQLDYVTGEAFAINIRPGEQGAGVRGAVAEFENAAVLGNLRERSELVRRMCAGRSVPDASIPRPPTEHDHHGN